MAAYKHCRLIPAMLALAPVAHAELTASVDAGIGFSDNIGRSSVEKVDETLATFGLNLDAERAEGRLTGMLGADIGYTDYVDDTYDDDVYGRVDLAGDYAFVTDFFSWRLEDSWGQIRSDPFAVQNPDNVENTNFFATGPDFTFQLGTRTQLLVTGRWSDTAYEKSQRDYTRLGGGLGLSRNISERTTVGMHGYAARVEFKNGEFGSDYDAQEYYGSFATEGARTRIKIDVGYTEIHDREESSGNPLFRLTIARDVTPRSVLRLTAGTEFSDAGRVFQGIGEDNGGPGAGNPSDVIGVGDPFERRFFSFGWTTEGRRGRFGLGLNFRQEQYEMLTPLDRDVTTIYANFSRGLTQTVRLSLGANYEMEETDNGSVDDDRLWLNAGLAWDFSRRFFVSADYNFYKGDSNSTLRNYDESRAWLRVGYRVR